ncbi:MAG: hypothetical protein P8N09_11410 [Planctomycetota bacterium]|nr:hypothetical protein [Planctomycetota bacterium]
MNKHILTFAALCLLTGLASAQTFTVTGMFEYEDKGWSYNGWNGADGMRPIRHADVTVLNDATGAVIGTGSTDESGEFSIEASGTGTINVVVRVNADTNLDPVFQRLRVTTTGNVEYSAFSPVFNGHDTASSLDVGTTSVLKSLSGSNEGNPFNMLDMGVSGFDYITGPLVNDTTVGTIRMNWPGSGGSFASGSSLTMSSDDGYDDAVILHELGHVVQNLYSDSDNTGGGHFFGDSDQDPRLSMGEGYATFFGGTVMVHVLGRAAHYMDANASSQTGGVQLRLRLEETTPYANDSFGAADEVSVACTLFDILDDENSPDQNSGTDDDDMDSTVTINGLTTHRAWWDTFEGPMDTAPNLVLNHAWDGWFSEHGAGGMYTEMKDIFDDHRARFYEDSDEPNNVFNDAVPTSVGAGWSPVRTLYKSTASPPAPGSGDFDWFSDELVKGSVVTIETRYPNNVSDADTQCDTEVSLWDESVTNHATAESGGTGRNAKISAFTVPSTGTWRWRFRTTSSMRYYGSYDWRATYDFENFMPVINSGPSALPATIPDDQTSLLSVSASDANGGQTLTYTWTSLSGGTISGSGSSVTFVPPTVTSSTVCDIALTVSDNLGATTDEVIVQVTVDPAGGPCGSGASTTAGGVGKAGQVGTPVLSAIGQPVIPSTTFKLQMTNALPFAQAYVFAGFSLISAPFDGGTLYPATDRLFLATVPGSGTLDMPLPLDDPVFCGVAFFVQVLVPFDPGATGTYQTSQTNYVEVVPGS